MVLYNNIYVPILLDNCVILSNYNFCPSNKYKGYLGYQSTFLCLSTYVYIFLCMVIYIPFSDLILCPFLLSFSYRFLCSTYSFIYLFAKISSKLLAFLFHPVFQSFSAVTKFPFRF